MTTLVVRAAESCCGGNARCLLRVRAAALLVFFPGAARTGIVASDLGRAADDLLHCLQIAGTRHAGLIQFAALPALEGFFDFVHGRGYLPWLAPIAISTHSWNRRTRFRTCATFAGPLQNLHQVKIADGLFLGALHHGFEHVERFAL